MKAVGLSVAGLAVLLLVLRPDLGRGPSHSLEIRDGSIQQVAARKALATPPPRRTEVVVEDDVETLPPGVQE